MKEVARAFDGVQRELSAREGIGALAAREILAPLQEELLGSFTPGQSIELSPQAMVDFAVERVRAGEAPAAVGPALRDAHLNGALRQR